MTDRLPPALLAKLDQLHEANVSRFDGMLATPGLCRALKGQGEAMFCADTTNTLMAGVENGVSDAQDLAALLAIAIARLVRINAEGTTK